MKNKNVLMILLLSITIVTIGIVFLRKYENDVLLNANYSESKDTLLAITVDGNEASSFPTSSGYTATVTCTNGTGSATWNGSKWVFSVSTITANKTRCNISFEFSPTWDSPGSGTLLAAIKKANTVISSPSTYPGQKISASNEAALVSKEDDYGTSYYFRGAVTNNFVEYANMCWRIVRVTGDGSIKLVLYSYNGLTSTNNIRLSSTPCNTTGTDYAFARYDGTTFQSKFNTTTNDNAYIGLMYGTVGASSYASAHANNNASTILTSLNLWYTNVLSRQSGFSDSQLADTIWCNDKNVVTDTTYDPWSIGYGTNYGYGTNINYYKTLQRLYSRVNNLLVANPSLVCQNDKNGGKLSKFTVSDTTYGNGALKNYAKIGLLTADEVAFAGGAYQLSNTTFYLNQNATTEIWYTLSPTSFTTNYGTGVFVVDGDDGSKLTNDNAYYDRALRPSISLKSKVKITSGSGTASSPYKISS